MMDKPLHYWIALIVGILIVIERHKEKPRTARIGIAAISGGMGFSLSPEAAIWTGRSETLAAMIITAFGYLVIDVLTALVADREFLKEIIRRRLGGKNDEL